MFGNTEDAVNVTDGIGQIVCDTMREFKLGAHPIAGLSAARVLINTGAIWLINRTDTLTDSKNYAHGHALEFYNSGHYDYSELEWHSPSTNLQPEQSHIFDLNYQVMWENPDQTPLEIYQMIESQDGLRR